MSGTGEKGGLRLLVKPTRDLTLIMCRIRDLEQDYLNPYDTSSHINVVVIPEMVAHGVWRAFFLEGSLFVVKRNTQPSLRERTQVEQLVRYIVEEAPEDAEKGQTFKLCDKMKEEKAKEKGASIKDVEDSSRPARSTLTLKPLPTIDPKDKGKSVLEEPEPRKTITRRWKGKVQRKKKALKAAIAKMYDEVQAWIGDDTLFAAKLQ
ncbi:retrovirus-related pol polyprotein from transposon TNT 1-94 [Tanacetum coccineum]